MMAQGVHGEGADTQSSIFMKDPNAEITTMKSVILHKNGDPMLDEVLTLGTVPIPEPGEGEMLVKVHAAAINPVDWKLMQGVFPGQKSGPCGCDVSGVVEQLGPTSGLYTHTPLKRGDEVYADAIDTKGAFGEYVVVKDLAASKKPSNISFEEAAALPLAALTALQGLQLHGQLKDGQKVLIFGGSGGVGSLAVQMAKALGASEVYATGSDVELIKSLGAEVVVNYKEESLMDALKDKEFDLVFDTVGGHEHWEVAMVSMKKTGKFLTIVGDGGSMAKTAGQTVWRKMKAAVKVSPSYHVFLTNTTYEGVAKDMKQITAMVEAGLLKVLMDERRFEFTLEGVREMIKASMSHRAKGKLVLQVRK